MPTLGELLGIEHWNPAHMDGQEVRRKAEECYQQGYRLEGWGLVLTDTCYATTLSKDGERVGYWEDGTSRRTEQAYSLLGIEGEADFCYEVCRQLDCLTSVRSRS